jgi:hypothetical protein
LFANLLRKFPRYCACFSSAGDYPAAERMRAQTTQTASTDGID